MEDDIIAVGLGNQQRVAGPLARTEKIPKMEGIVIDTNVFVAAGFNPRSAPARVLAAVRDERFHLIWNQSTRREIEMMLRRTRRLDWEEVANLFQPEGEFTGPLDPSAFVLVRDRDDRKFAALSAAAERPLAINDNYLLTDLSKIGIDALTPRAFLARVGGPYLEAGGTIENARASRRTKPTHHQTVRSHRRRDPLDKVERIANLI